MGSEEVHKHKASRVGVTQVDEGCPRRPYVELQVPSSVREVTAVTFTTVSRDQGWADDPNVTNTWFEVYVRRRGDRGELRTVWLHSNRGANPTFFEQRTRLDSGRSRVIDREWLRALRPGDVLQLIPKALFHGWVNIIREASIEIEYEALDAGEQPPPRQKSWPLATHAGFYSPLLHEQRQIRVLVVEPGPLEAEIMASFEIASLAGGPDDKQVDFDALSYCWGDKADSAAISLMQEPTGGGTARPKPFRVAATVQRAIRRLRRPNAPLRIWIDAVCINQEDLNERAAQVAMMALLYSRAAAVHVWLDEEIVGLGAGLRLVRDLHNLHNRHCDGAEACRCYGTRHTLSSAELDAMTASTTWGSEGFIGEVFDLHRAKPAFDAAAIEAAGGEHDLGWMRFLQTLFLHPWFQRVWVVQEAILCERTYVHAAGETVLWQEVLMVNEIVGSGRFTALALSHRGRTAMPAVWQTLAPFRGRRLDNEVHGKVDKNPVSMAAAAKDALQKERDQKPLAILQVFLAALDLKASDARDKLYALLGFGHETRSSERIPALLRPDYGKSLERVMADFTRWCIVEHRSLDVLSHIHCQPTRAWRRTLCDDDVRLGEPVERPSWTLATEGHAQWAGVTLRELSVREFRAGADTVPDLALLSIDDHGANPLQLRLRGRKVCELKRLGHPPRELIMPSSPTVPGRSRDEEYGTDAYGTLSMVWHRLFDPSQRLGCWALNGSNYHYAPLAPDALRMNMNAHVAAHHGYVPATGSAADAVESCVTLRPILEEGSARAVGCEVYRRVEWELPPCIERCFFVASDNYYGLCPWTAREGDAVAVLHGGKVPFLLRPVLGDAETTDGDHGGGERYELVGECYVEGIMDGEVVKEGVMESVFVLV